MSDRKYRQHGYQDSGGDKQQRPSLERPARKDTFGPRPMQMPGTHEVSRCAQCGTLLTMLSDRMRCLGVAPNYGLPEAQDEIIAVSNH